MMTYWPVFVSLLEPATVTLVGGAAALFASIPLAIQGAQLLAFRAALMIAALTMVLAALSLLSYSFSVDALGPQYQGIFTAVSGVLCFLCSLVFVLQIALKRPPWRIVTVLWVVCMVGFFFTKQSADITQWANICQFLIAVFALGLAFVSDDLASNHLKWSIAAFAGFIALCAVLCFWGLDSFLAASPLIDVSSSIQSMRIGALMKAVMPILGYACVVGIVQSKVANRLRVSLNQDVLTRAYSRRYLFERGAELLRNARAPGQDLPALLLIDLDLFKAVNDRWGHSVGDQVLKHAVECIYRGVADESCIVGRFGGEEFCVLIPSASAQEVHSMAERIRLAVALDPYQNGHIKIDLTVSIGFAQHHGARSVDALVALADAGLYRAKRSGRNQSFDFSGSLVPV
jgi:diguanylate cyclase (GGDEF)-like protein